MSTINTYLEVSLILSYNKLYSPLAPWRKSYRVALRHLEMFPGNEESPSLLHIETLMNVVENKTPFIKCRFSFFPLFFLRSAG